jgi:two-component system phosphate regulon response regulator OmpR
MIDPAERPLHILVVDDDPRIRQMLTRYFEKEGYRVSTAADGAAMRTHLSARPVDVILLDVVLPGPDGLTIARELRATSDVGIIMLTSRDEVLDRVVGLEVGADDYIAKPFHLREVLARVKSVVRRRKPALESVGRSEDRRVEVIRFDGWILDTARRQLVSPSGKDVVLTSGQFDLLAALATHPGRVFSRETLMEHTRGHGTKAFDRTIDAQIARLRQKIERDPKRPTIVKSVRAVGYVFTARVDR